jgi:2-C-methyl-D-erythritol 4-phosphate cytidylyltransferase
MRYWLVMPAAGLSSRFGADGPKQYAPLEGRTVIEWALAPFLADPRCAQIVVALARDDTGWMRVAARLAAPGRSSVTTVDGGAQRSHSVRLALAVLQGRAGPDEWVLVHDAARPCLDAHDLERLLGRLGAHPVGGLLAIPVADTLKRAQGEGPGSGVGQTVDRSGLWRALTPQMFRYGRLCAALDQAHAAGRFPSDEAQALEWLGEHPALIEGAATNLKITTGEDLSLAAAVLAARRSQGRGGVS